MVFIWYYDLPFVGRCGICEDGLGVCRVFLPECSLPPEGTLQETALLQQAAAQLAEYFSGKRRSFHLPLSLSGTSFQKAVWNQLMSIPYGKTTSYGELAKLLGIPRSAQAVGQAVGANPIPFIIPCHRVIGKNGSITGYALGIERKKHLLKLEQQ